MIQIIPTHGNARLVLGNSGKHVQALECYNIALELDPVYHGSAVIAVTIIMETDIVIFKAFILLFLFLHYFFNVQP
jgi:hypothetical protein